MSLVMKQGTAYALNFEAPDENGALFAQAYVYAADGTTLLSTVTLTFKSRGRYTGSYTPGASGTQIIEYKFFLDAGFTTPALAYGLGSDNAEVHVADIDSVSALATAIKTNTDNIPSVVTAATIARKLLQNEWRIDPATNQLTIYADGGFPTVFAVYNLQDGAGDPTTTNVRRRIPV